MCRVEGNGDLYGLGIRVGVYLSLAASLYAKYHLSSALSGILITNGVFVFALLITVAHNAASQQLRPIDGYVILRSSSATFCAAQKQARALSALWNLYFQL